MRHLIKPVTRTNCTLITLIKSLTVKYNFNLKYKFQAKTVRKFKYQVLKQSAWKELEIYTIL